MQSPLKAAVFLLLLLFLLSSAADGDPDPAAAALLDRHAAQLDRLETLISALSTTVAALESSLAACPAAPSPSPVVLAAPSPHASAGVAVRKHKPLWSERFNFAAAVHLHAPATRAAVLPYEDSDGITKYFAVGDAHGKLYIFSAAGDLVMELPTVSDSPVTSILAYLSFRKNESLLFTGHGDGSVSAHRLYESVTNDWLTLSLGSSRPFIRGGRDMDSPAVTGLEVHQVGRNRYIFATDGSGRIRVFTEIGTLYGTAIASSRPLAFVKQRLVFLTETGAASLDLRSMVVKEVECEGLNGTAIKSYSFDVSEWTKAYGFTADGDLVHVILLGDAGNLKCRVRSIRKSEIENPVSIRTIKGYLLVGSLDKVFVYNISSQYFGRVGAPRPLFFATIQEIKSQFMSSEVAPVEEVLTGDLTPVEEFLTGEPLIAADREKLVVLGLGGGYIGIYRSSFPVYRIESNGVVWGVPALVFLMFLIGIWQFYVKKKDSLGWTPDEAFKEPGAKSGSHLSPPAGDRAYAADAPRDSDFRARRGGALRDPSRMYATPPRYPGESSMAFRPTSTESGFRATADLKFRGQGIEAAGLSKRKDPLFPDTEVVDDHSD